jgi:hypothetical protein
MQHLIKKKQITITTPPPIIGPKITITFKPEELGFLGYGLGLEFDSFKVIFSN